MGKSKRAILTTLLVLTVALWVSGCPKGAYHDATVAEHDAKVTVQAFQQAETAAFKAGQITAAEHQVIEAAIAKVGTAGLTLTTALQSGATQTTVLGDLAVLTQAVGDLGSQGVLGLKDPTAKAALSASVQAIQAVLQNLSAILAAPTTTTGSKP